MIKHIIHIADIHIPNDEETRPYSEMIESFLAELYSKVKDFNKEEFRIVIVGDIFQQKIKTSNESKEIFHMMLNYLNAMGQTIIVAGNHDMLENNRKRKDSISPTFSIHNVYNNITYLDKKLNYKSGIVVDDNVVWVLYSMFDKFRQIDIAPIREKYPDHKIIGLFHGEVNGVVNDIGTQLNGGLDGSIFEGCDCVMAGHIHKHQEIKKNGVPIVYSGSLFQKDAGENITGHGFVIWDVDKLSYKLHQVQNKYKIYCFNISSYEDIQNDKEILINY